MGNKTCPAQEGRTPRGTRQKKEFSETLARHPVSFAPNQIPGFQFHLFLLASKWCLRTSFGSLGCSPQPPTARCLMHSQSENTIFHVSRVWTLENHFSAALYKFTFPSINEREVVLTFFGTSENDNFIVFSDSKRRNQKTSPSYSLKVESHLSK